MRTAGALALGALLTLGGGAAGPSAQAAEPLRQAGDPNPPYDGRFTFVRLRYQAQDRSPGGGYLGGRRRGDPMWSHDLPRADTNFLRIIQELTSVSTDPDHRLSLAADDPALFRYPVAYVVEVGYWVPTETEVKALRTWLLKGGFLIVDDFRGAHWRNFEAQMQRILPDLRFQPLAGREAVFDSFFHIGDPYALVPPYEAELAPVYLGMYEGNDPSRRMMVIANYNQDIAEYWEFSDYGYYPIDLSNDAYKFGVNYVIYGLTH